MTGISLFVSLVLPALSSVSLPTTWISSPIHKGQLLVRIVRPKNSKAQKITFMDLHINFF